MQSQDGLVTQKVGRSRQDQRIFVKSRPYSDWEKWIGVDTHSVLDLIDVGHKLTREIGLVHLAGGNLHHYLVRGVVR